MLANNHSSECYRKAWHHHRRLLVRLTQLFILAQAHHHSHLGTVQVAQIFELVIWCSTLQAVLFNAAYVRMQAIQRGIHPPDASFWDEVRSNIPS